MKKMEVVDYHDFTEELLAQFESRKRLRFPKNKKIFEGKLVEQAALVLSDIHTGKKNYFPNEEGTSTLTYSPEIMWREATRLVGSVSDINQLLSSSYDIKRLNIFALGDLIDNDLIIQGQRFFVDAGAGAQLMTGVSLMTSLINEFLKMFDEIDVVVIGGNHGRINARARDMTPFYNNFDWLLGEILKIQFKDEKRVQITCPESWFIVKTIMGWRYMLHHGNTVWSWMGLPYYGITRKSTTRRGEIGYDLECLGHWHQRIDVPIGSSVMAIVNGCWIENDDFAWRQYGVLTKPQQYYFGISPKRPRSWQFNIDLLKGKR